MRCAHVRAPGSLSVALRAHAAAQTPSPFAAQVWGRTLTRRSDHPGTICGTESAVISLLRSTAAARGGEEWRGRAAAGSRGCGLPYPAAAILVPYAGVVEAAVAAPPECVDGESGGDSGASLDAHHRCMCAIKRTYRTLHVQVLL